MCFYSEQHQYYCGIDLHARTMYLCVIDQEGTVLIHRNLPTEGGGAPLRAIEPYREDLVVAVECIFTWYWIADLCTQLQIPFVLGHALYMKPIHGGKTKDDKIDSQKIAAMLRGGMFPMAYACPEMMRSTRDLLRRRNYLMHHRSELLAHIQNTRSQYNLPAFEKRIAARSNRAELADHFEEPMVRESIEADITVLDTLHEVLLRLEQTVLDQARHHDPVALQLIRTIPGIGKVLSLMILLRDPRCRSVPRGGQLHLLRPPGEVSSRIGGQEKRFTA